MKSSKSKSAVLTTRVSPDVRTQFLTKSAQYGTPSDVLREFISAFIEERISIKPPVNVKGNLYVS